MSNISFDESNVPKYGGSPKLTTLEIQGDTAKVSKDSYSRLPSSYFTNSQFIQYDALAKIASNPIISSLLNTITRDAFRNWGELSGENVQEFEKRFEDLKVKDVLTEAFRTSLIMGGAMIFLDAALAESENLSDPLTYAIGADKPLRSLKVVEPMYCVPNDYDLSNPLDPSFFKPRNWSITKTTDSSRLIPLVPIPVPDSEKPKYNFFGISYIGQVYPAVDRYELSLENIKKMIRKSQFIVWASKLLDKYSPGKKSDAEITLQARTNRLANEVGTGSVVMINEGESIQTVDASFSNLDSVVGTLAQSISISAGVPSTKALAETPKGLNATGEYEIQTYDDVIIGYQSDVIQPAIDRILQVLERELNLEAPKFNFSSLRSPSEIDKLDMDLKRAQRDSIMLENGTIQLSDTVKVANEHMDDYRDLKVKEEPELGNSILGDMRETL